MAPFVGHVLTNFLSGNGEENYKVNDLNVVAPEAPAEDEDDEDDVEWEEG